MGFHFRILFLVGSLKFWHLYSLFENTVTVTILTSDLYTILYSLQHMSFPFDPFDNALARQISGWLLEIIRVVFPKSSSRQVPRIILVYLTPSPILSPPTCPASSHTRIDSDHSCGHVQSHQWVWLCVTPWTLSHQVPLSMEFSRQEYWGGLPCLSPGDLPYPGMTHASLMSLALEGRFLTT